MTDFGIQKALQELGLKDINAGTSTGSNNFSSGEMIESYSPVDGKLIGKVKSTSKEDYEKVIKTASEAFYPLEKCLLHKEEKLYVNSGINYEI